MAFLFVCGKTEVKSLFRPLLCRSSNFFFLFLERDIGANRITALQLCGRVGVLFSLRPNSSNYYPQVVLPVGGGRFQVVLFRGANCLMARDLIGFRVYGLFKSRRATGVVFAYSG